MQKRIIIAKRVITKIGDVFSFEINETQKMYLQYIANDMSQLNSDVIKVFKKIYNKIDNPSLQEIVEGEIAFYFHCDTRAGVKRELWNKVGNIKINGDLSNILFCCKDDWQNEKVDDWYVWEINKATKRIGKMDSKYSKSYIGFIFPVHFIVNKVKYGYYEGFLEYYERNYLNT